MCVDARLVDYLAGARLELPDLGGQFLEFALGGRGDDFVGSGDLRREVDKGVRGGQATRRVGACPRGPLVARSRVASQQIVRHKAL